MARSIFPGIYPDQPGITRSTRTFGSLRNHRPVNAKEGEIIEDYPEDTGGHSCLILGRGGDGRPIHIVCAPKDEYLNGAWKRTISYRSYRKDMHVSLDNVSAWVCTQCGEVYFAETECHSAATAFFNRALGDGGFLRALKNTSASRRLRRMNRSRSSDACSLNSVGLPTVHITVYSNILVRNNISYTGIVRGQARPYRQRYLHKSPLPLAG